VTTGLDEFHASGSNHGGGVDPSSTANPPWAWRGGSGECHDLGFATACWYQFSDDQTSQYDAPVAWPTAPLDGRLLAYPQGEILMRFPFLPGLDQPTHYNPYIGVSPSDPPAKFSVSMGGEDVVTSGIQYGWSANVTGGVGPYTYQWSGALSGTGQTVQVPLFNDDVLYLDDWDGAGAHIALSKAISVTPSCGQQIICSRCAYKAGMLRPRVRNRKMKKVFSNED